jgi:hypothetical protein
LGGGLLKILQEAPDQLDNLVTRIAKALFIYNNYLA